MRYSRLVVAAALIVGAVSRPAYSQRGTTTQDSAPDPVRMMVARLDLERYKATIKDLTQFGDRRQGTDRNRAAVDWIEAQLKKYGCTNTERIKYEYTGRQLRNDSTNKVDSLRNAANPNAAGGRGGAGGGRAAGGGRGRGGGRANNPAKGYTARTGVNINPDLQPDTALRRINAQPDTPGPREEVYCTKIGSTHPE